MNYGQQSANMSPEYGHKLSAQMYSEGVNVAAPREPTLLAAAASSHNIIADRLEVLLGRMENVALRTFGPRPSEDGLKNPEPKPVGVEQELRIAATCVENIIARMQSVMADIERIA